MATLAEARALAETCHRNGLTVVSTNGCFDLLHVGHVRGLEQAAALGDVLFVGVNSDRGVCDLKGEGRPVYPEAARVAMLEALFCVFCAVPFDEEWPAQFLQAVRPDVHVKGGDRRAEDLPETPLVESWGGRVVIVPRDPPESELSTSVILARLAGV